jgi:hypothetical protein
MLSTSKIAAHADAIDAALMSRDYSALVVAVCAARVLIDDLVGDMRFAEPRSGPSLATCAACIEDGLASLTERWDFIGAAHDINDDSLRAIICGHYRDSENDANQGVATHDQLDWLGAWEGFVMGDGRPDISAAVNHWRANLVGQSPRSGCMERVQ